MTAGSSSTSTPSARLCPGVGEPCRFYADPVRGYCSSCSRLVATSAPAAGDAPAAVPPEVAVASSPLAAAETPDSPAIVTATDEAPVDGGSPGPSPLSDVTPSSPGDAAALATPSSPEPCERSTSPGPAQPVPSSSSSPMLTPAGSIPVPGSAAVPSPVLSASPSLEGSASSPAVAGGSSSPPKSAASGSGPSRCAVCRKRLGLLGFTCRCLRTLCGSHRAADAHQCEIDYRARARAHLQAANPAVVATKIDKI
ncbi:hypothetical protein H696_02346 [Fonticula alba]|uniref:AN1-type domain-containing protein n=1 Tax=Fonticula alba TaxID=691883 RepID=A0A058ZAH7_FONAL|nr:hypothetical protein H696_02346 [Fonticula alba]KCV71399.1 hypothetical protein H696_02346 [Fonticula alba]|eukprot:XP_009494522.1 hypothetical protein H696_02346 [Fonticula alba]